MAQSVRGAARIQCLRFVHSPDAAHCTRITSCIEAQSWPRNISVFSEQRHRHLHHQHDQQRPYATARPAPRPKPSPKQQAPSKQHLFRPQDFSLAMFERLLKDQPDLVPSRRSAAEYFGIAQAYFTQVLEGTPEYAVNLTSQNISPQDLHEAGCVLYATRQQHADYVASTMWASASAQGHLPSTLSLAFRIAASGKWGKSNVKYIEAAESRFNRMLAASNPDSNTLFVEGFRLARAGNDVGAERLFQRALQRDSSSFEWKDLCRLSLGQAYRNLGKEDVARDIFEELSEKGVYDADLELARALRMAQPDRAEELFLSAINSNSPYVYGQLSEISWERSQKSQSPQGKAEAEVWAKEWSRLANAKHV